MLRARKILSKKISAASRGPSGRGEIPNSKVQKLNEVTRDGENVDGSRYSGR